MVLGINQLWQFTHVNTNVTSTMALLKKGDLGLLSTFVRIVRIASKMILRTTWISAHQLRRLARRFVIPWQCIHFLNTVYSLGLFLFSNR